MCPATTVSPKLRQALPIHDNIGQFARQRRHEALFRGQPPSWGPKRDLVSGECLSATEARPRPAELSRIGPRYGGLPALSTSARRRGHPSRSVGNLALSSSSRRVGCHRRGYSAQPDQSMPSAHNESFTQIGPTVGPPGHSNREAPAAFQHLQAAQLACARVTTWRKSGLRPAL